MKHSALELVLGLALLFLCGTAIYVAIDFAAQNHRMEAYFREWIPQQLEKNRQLCGCPAQVKQP